MVAKVLWTGDLFEVWAFLLFHVRLLKRFMQHFLLDFRNHENYFVLIFHTTAFFCFCKFLHPKTQREA